MATSTLTEQDLSTSETSTELSADRDDPHMDEEPCTIRYQNKLHGAPDKFISANLIPLYSNICSILSESDHHRRKKMSDGLISVLDRQVRDKISVTQERAELQRMHRDLLSLQQEVTKMNGSAPDNISRFIHNQLQRIVRKRS